MRIALLISGYLRGFKENVDSIKQNIIQFHDCDIYIHITDSDSDKYLNEKISISYIKDALNPTVLIFSKNMKFTENERVNNILNQNYKYYLLNQERNKKCLIEKIKYDVVVKLRPDTWINGAIDFSNVKSLYIPSDSKIDISKLQSPNDKYICDIFAYGTSDKMDEYFNYYECLNKLIEKYDTCVNETLLLYYLQDCRIEYEIIDIQFIVILSLCNVIAITGDSGSGKTSLANIIKNIFNNSFVLECDRYHKWERNNEQWKSFTHLNPESNYITKMCNDVFDLKIGNTVYQIDYNHSTGCFTDKQRITSSDNIIVCGLHSLYMPDNIVNLKIFIDTDDNLKIPWKMKRDILKRGYSIEQIYTQIQNRQSDYLTHIYPQKKVANIIIQYYTDNVFDILTFDIIKEYSIYLKMHIKRNITFNPIPEIERFEYEGEYVVIYFTKLDNYNDVIKQMLMSIKCT